MQARLFEWHEQHKHVVVQSYEQNQLQVHGRRFYVRCNPACRHLHNLLCIYSLGHMPENGMCHSNNKTLHGKVRLSCDSDQTVVR